MQNKCFVSGDIKMFLEEMTSASQNLIGNTTLMFLTAVIMLLKL